MIIAVVDDDAGMRAAAKDLLRSLGYAVINFASAEEFLQSAQIGETTCLLTDVKMPGMNGVDLQQKLMDKGYRIPVIFMTAFPEENEKKRALEAGAFGFLTKPFQTQNLIECLDQALQS